MRLHARRAEAGRTRRRGIAATQAHEPVARSLCLLLAGTAALTAMAVMVRHRTRDAEAHHPPAGRFITVDGVRLHYLDRGEGKPLVLVHGAGALVEDFMLSGLVAQAAERYRVIVFDRPGYGHSERPRGTSWTPEAQAELLHKALRALGAKQPIILGHSWGTLVALAHALRYPADTGGLILLGGYFYPTPRPAAALMSIPAIPLVGNLLRHTILPLSGRLLWPGIVRKLFAPSPVPPAFTAFPTGMALRPSQLRAATDDIAGLIPAAARLSGHYGELTVPVAILAGTADRICDTQAHSGRLYETLSPDTFYRLVPEAGHMIHHVAPGQALALIDAVAKAAASGTAPAARHPRPVPPPEDLVEENSEDSFPASDPPNYAAGIPGRPDEGR